MPQKPTRSKYSRPKKKNCGETKATRIHYGRVFFKTPAYAEKGMDEFFSVLCDQNNKPKFKFGKIRPVRAPMYHRCHGLWTNCPLYETCLDYVIINGFLGWVCSNPNASRKAETIQTAIIMNDYLEHIQEKEAQPDDDDFIQHFAPDLIPEPPISEMPLIARSGPKDPSPHKN